MAENDRLTVSEVAQRLNKTAEAIRKRIRRGTLPAYKSNGRWYVAQDRLPEIAASGVLPEPATGQDDALLAQLQTENAFLRNQVTRLTGMLEAITQGQLPSHTETGPGVTNATPPSSPLWLPWQHK